MGRMTLFSIWNEDAHVLTSSGNPTCYVCQSELSYFVLIMKYLKWEKINFLFAEETMCKVLASLNFRDTLVSNGHYLGDIFFMHGP